MLFGRKIVFSLVSFSQGFLTKYNGPLFRAAFLKMLSERNPHLAKTVHDSQERKPYSVTSLRPVNQKTRKRTRRQDFRIMEGDRLVCSLSIFDPYLMENLLHTLTSEHGWDIRIGNLSFSVEKIEVQSLDVATLFQKATEINRVSVSFMSPTFFKTTDGAAGIEFFPRPRVMFGFLVNQWETFAAKSDPLIPEGFSEWINQKVKISSFHVRTDSSHVMKGTPIAGTIGWIRLEWPLEEQFHSWPYVLLKIGEFSGVGAARTAGYGEIKVREVLATNAHVQKQGLSSKQRSLMS